MILTNITSPFKFYEEKDGYLCLKNVGEYCIFFDSSSNKCKIYEHRPRGCRLYPFVYDNGKCIIDRDCKNRENIKYIDKNTENKVKNFVKLLEKERESRLTNRKR